METVIKKPELLCPAGSTEAFAAAIEGGADAIYVGGTAFNARMNAKNFTEEELRRAISLAHAYGVKVYVATNTLIYDVEMGDMLKAAETAYLCGADALIVADMGAATEIRRRIPIDLHASTQMSGHGAEAAKYLSELGFTRMVCAREMSREDLTTLVNESPIEIEAFVHGALCVCHSGQCLFSSLVGGRSGNRGECAQPCRLPFKNRGGNEYPLSLKDLSLAEYVPELCNMGIASFKIEGRMKSPEYVRDVARIWRRLIDEGRGATLGEMTELSEIFSRGGFTDGYYTGRIDRKMLGIRSESDKQSSRELEPFGGITKKIPVAMTARLAEGEPMELTVSAKGISVTVRGAVPERAINAPLSEEAVRKNLTKLGNTPYFADSCHIEIAGAIMTPLSAVNALRRAAIDKLSEGDSTRSEGDIIATELERPTPSQKQVKGNSAYFCFPERIPREAREFFDILYVPLDKFDGSTNGVALPGVIFDSEKKQISELIRRAEELGCEHVLVGNAGHMELVRGSKMKCHGDFRLNISNSYTAAHYSRELEDIILAPELTLPKLRDIKKSCPSSRAIVYGRIPLMITEKCVGKELGDCRSCEEGRTTLTDRRGVVFPVIREHKHRSLIVNSVPLYMADKAYELERFGIFSCHFIFTTESEREIAAVIDAYKNKKPPRGDVRRIK